MGCELRCRPHSPYILSGAGSCHQSMWCTKARACVSVCGACGKLWTAVVLTSSSCSAEPIVLTRSFDPLLLSTEAIRCWYGPSSSRTNRESPLAIVGLACNILDGGPGAGGPYDRLDSNQRMLPAGPFHGTSSRSSNEYTGGRWVGGHQTKAPKACVPQASDLPPRVTLTHRASPAATPVTPRPHAATYAARQTEPETDARASLKLACRESDETRTAPWRCAPARPGVATAAVATD